MLWQYRIILSADTASEVRQLLSQKSTTEKKGFREISIFKDGVVL